jgi:hypothetical protein
MKRAIQVLIITLCVINAARPQNYKVLEYLKSISGKKTIAGEQNREVQTPSLWSDSLYAATGKYPGFWSSDFLWGTGNFEYRWKMIKEAKRQWDNGAIVQLMYHTCPPTEKEECSWSGDAGSVLSTLTDAQWSDLITDGTAINKNWKSRLDSISVYLQYLKDNGVEVLFRPLHEMNQGAFWWGGRTGSNGTARLYQITHDYLVKTKGLTNLIWVWDLQDFSTIATDVNNYDPGSSYWDVLAFDVYWSDGTGYTAAKYNAIVNKAGSKPIAIGECEVLPTASILTSQPRWTFFMDWSELVFSSNSISQIKALYNSSKVITLDQMPGWKSYCAYNGTPYSVPGTIEAENFDNCGAGASYYDTDTINTGGQYRTEVGVDIENCSGGGYDVTDIHSGEWLNYALSFDTAGIYTIEARVASAAAGKKFHIELDGENVSGEITVPNTGGAQQWAAVSITTPQLSLGTKVMRIVMDADSFNIDNVKFTISNKAPFIQITSPEDSAKYTSPATVKITVNAADVDGSISKVEYYNGAAKLGESSKSPFTFVWTNVTKGSYLLSATATDNSGLTTLSDTVKFSVVLPELPYDTIPYPIPGRIEAENYDLGGQGIAYYDLSSGNKFNIYRFDDVDVGKCNDTTGGYAIGNFQLGEWVQYTVNVTKEADYDIEFRVNSTSANSAISLLVDSVDVTGKLVVPTTGSSGWTSIVKKDIPLTAGKKILKLIPLAEFANINYIAFSPSAAEDVDKYTEVMPKDYKLYQNYPNPFNPATNIKYDVPKNSYVLIKVYNILGKEISTLVKQEKSAGSYEVHFDGSRLSSGIYFYTIRVGNYLNTKQMVLIK